MFIVDADTILAVNPVPINVNAVQNEVAFFLINPKACTKIFNALDDYSYKMVTNEDRTID